MIEGGDDHVFHLTICQAISGLHLDLGFLATTLLAGADMQNAIGVNQKLHLDARQSCGHRGDALKIEARK